VTRPTPDVATSLVAALVVTAFGRDELFLGAIVFGIGVRAKFLDVALSVTARLHAQGAGVEVEGARSEK
jgi:hypothetical protein